MITVQQLSEVRLVMLKKKRKNHDAMRNALLAAATRIVRSKGFSGLSVRNLADKLDMSIGTIYNYVADIHEVALSINEQTIRLLMAELDKTIAVHPTQPDALVDTYFDFLEANKKRWRALFEHYPPPGYAIPESYSAAIEQVVTRISIALAPRLATVDDATRRDITVGLWAMLHGLSILEQQGKLGRISGSQSLRQIAQATLAKALDNNAQKGAT